MVVLATYINCMCASIACNLSHDTFSMIKVEDIYNRHRFEEDDFPVKQTTVLLFTCLMKISLPSVGSPLSTSNCDQTRIIFTYNMIS